MQGGDTVFCFTTAQAQSIAIHLELGRYCDSLLDQSERQIQQLCDLQAISDSSMYALTQKTHNQELILGNKQTELENINLKLNTTERKFNAERWQKRAFLVASIVLGTWLIFK